MDATATLRRTPLHSLHVEHGGRMVPFAGWEMPVQYRGMITEHEHTREAASLFDVAHMGVATIEGEGAAQALESVVVGAVSTIKTDRSRYTLMTNDDGGIVDDLIVTNAGPHLGAVLNAARVDEDLAYLDARLPDSITVTLRRDLSLIALQGPQAVTVLGREAPAVGELRFMQQAHIEIDGIPVTASRSGYTGEDGFELTVPAAEVDRIARQLLATPEVELAGLGARDSLRLEAGLCLYGSDLDEATTPVEADLLWTIPKARRAEGGFPGHDVIARQVAEGPARVRVGIAVDGRRMIRPGAPLEVDGEVVGQVTSGAFGPTVGAPVAMGYVAAEHREPGTALSATERGKALPCHVAELPFVDHRYQR